MNRTLPFALVLASVGLATVFAFAQRGVTAAKPDPNAAPLFAEGQWLNTKEGTPVTLASRKGKPTLVAFWTFACSNCQANIPVYARLLAKYRPQGVEMISIHTPEMRVERDLEEVKNHVARFGIDYPVLIDNANANWNRWGVRYWPTLFVVDANGHAIRRWEGELNWQGADGEAQVGRVLEGLLAAKR